MRLDKRKLLELLHSLDDTLPSPLEMVLIGGSALSYLGLKVDTKDVDFFYNGMEFEELYEVTEKLRERDMVMLKLTTGIRKECFLSKMVELIRRSYL